MNKYGAKKQTVDGYTFDSQMEAAYYQHLKILKRAKEIKAFELQPVYVLQEAFRKHNRTFRAITYKADFLVTYNDGSQAVVDIKGAETEVFRIKSKLFRNRYELPLKVLTQDDGRWIELSKRRSKNVPANGLKNIPGEPRGKIKRGNKRGAKTKKSLARRQSGGSSVRILPVARRNEADQ